jgi:hypothetical protein
MSSGARSGLTSMEYVPRPVRVRYAEQYESIGLRRPTD